ncbi:fimbrial protein [Enterobacter bugandensis]|uniref:fimbrial protein n=1 Tax=Enterobacter bugandensis TaxID=881260 RepID=UPI000F84B9CE|nr:fimbrial protein [Enterobacter bugandensis]RTM18042.1 type 1 fimbrial protein [Enterobacter bugandensis]HDC4820310.1 type 1 fimbrial protein [Enterobacter bugandensis]HDR2403195.1 type 1 fimbrial protein [Enterobacter bugandensis]
MNKSVITMGFLLAAIASPSSHAAPGKGAGTIEFTGMITASTCDVDINGQGGNPTIDMGTISSSAFKEKGDVAGIHRIQIELSNCDTAVLKSAGARFGGAYDANDNNLLALKTGGDAATGLGIEFLNEDGTSLKLGDNPNKFVPITGDGTSGAATLLYSARYKSSLDAVTAGKADAVADYTIIYK